MFARQHKQTTERKHGALPVPISARQRSSHRATELDKKTGDVELRPFQNLYAPLVASWISHERELFWVAPATRAPLTAAKVASWKRGHCKPFLAFLDHEALPFGYAEVNPLGDGSGELWLGHIITDPARRGRGLGLRFIECLISTAFSEMKGDRLVLVVFPENDIAAHCYRRAGFSIAGRETRRFPGRRGVFTMLRMELKRADTNEVEKRSHHPVPRG